MSNHHLVIYLSYVFPLDRRPAPPRFVPHPSAPSSPPQGLKAADVRGKSVEEIDKEVADRKRALFDLRIKQATRQEIKTSEFKKLKKEVAMMLTVKRAMEIELGVDRRASKKMAKNAAVSVRSWIRPN